MLAGALAQEPASWDGPRAVIRHLRLPTRQKQDTKWRPKHPRLPVHWATAQAMCVGRLITLRMGREVLEGMRGGACASFRRIERLPVCCAH